MARTKVATDVKEKVATRLAMLSVNESKTAAEKVKVIYWTLGAVGFAEETVNEITARAEEIAEDFSDESGE